MYKCISRILPASLLCLFLLFCIKTTCQAGVTHVNYDTNYCVEITDDADILTMAEEARLNLVMKHITDYGNAAFVTTSYDCQDPQGYAQTYYAESFGEADGILLLYDAYNYHLELYCQGTFSESFSEPDELLELGAVYLFTHDFYDCANTIFTQIVDVLDTTETQLTPYHNAETGYYVYILDEAELLTTAEECDLQEAIMPITAYGNVAFVSVDYTAYSSEETASIVYSKLFGTDSGTLFLIDMDNRYIWIHSDGAIYDIITTSRANSITDNAYTLATDGEYYQCALSVYSQIQTLLEGGKIAQPMKYICNIILGLILAVAINFCWMSYCAYIKRPKNKELLEGIQHSFHYGQPTYQYRHQTRVAKASGGGHGHGGGHVHSGGGGGHRSGGGGGHRF